MAYWNCDNWKPNSRSIEILNKSMEHLKSVSYKVSARWLFYRLLQEGYYNKKADYNKFLHLTSRARHAFFMDWHPAVLADDTRAMLPFVTEGVRPESETNMMDNYIEVSKIEAEHELEEARTAYEDYSYSCSYPIDQKYHQAYILLILFEARAMSQQFQHYTDGITLCPFAGQASIPYKYEIAKFIEREHERYKKDAIVLYFGDLDDAGLKIFETGEQDISLWCDVPIHFVRCGLKEEHVEKYGIPANFEHPGYQWEALTDKQAQEIITEGIGDYFNYDAEEEAYKEQSRIENTVEEIVNGYVEQLRSV